MNYERTHELKIDECYFRNVFSGRKRFEIRYDDRDYQVGDWLILCCDRTTRGYPERLACKIIYKSTYQQQDRYCVLGFTVLEKQND